MWGIDPMSIQKHYKMRGNEGFWPNFCLLRGDHIQHSLHQEHTPMGIIGIIVSIIILISSYFECTYPSH